MKLWSKAMISSESSIREAIITIDASSLQIALVVDENQRLVGTVTDGDVRRGILQGVALHEAVSKIMQCSPIVAKFNDAKETILSLMKEKKVHQIPLLNQDGCVVGMEVLDEMLKVSERENWVVLMAGGQGTRLQPLTDDCPKPLLAIGKKPILQTILENFMEYGFKKFYIAVNYKSEMVQSYFGDGIKWNVEIQYLSENQRLGTAGALGLLPHNIKHPLIVMNGDLLTKINFAQLLNFYHESKADALMCVREYDFQVPFGVVNLDNHRITNIEEKPMHKFFVNAGIYVLAPQVLKSIPKKTPLDMPQLFEKLIRKKANVTAFPIREYWLDIGRLDDFNRANSEYPAVFH